MDLSELNDKELEEKLNKDYERYLEFLNKPLEIRLNIEFQKYLLEYNQNKDLIELSKTIKWEIILNSYKKEFELHWDKLIIPKSIPNLEILKANFEQMIFLNLKFILFNYLFRLLKDLINDTSLNINNKIEKDIRTIIFKFMDAFNHQLDLISLNKNNDPAIIITRIKKMQKVESAFSTGKKFNSNEIPIYEKIIAKINEAKENNIKPSIRELAHNSARIDLGYIHKKECEAFYKRFLNYKSKK